MRQSKYLLLILLLLAIILLSGSFLMEYVFVYTRWSFWQFFLAGFAIIGCGGAALFYFMLYSAHRKLLLDDLNVFVINFLLYLKDFRDNLQNHEAFDDSLERLKNITEQKNKLLETKRGFIIKGAYTSVINTYSKYIDEYVELHNKYVPHILKSKIPAERERLTVNAVKSVEDIGRRGYLAAKKYARRRGGGYKFNDFKVIVGGEEYERMEQERKAAEVPPQIPQAQKPPKLSKRQKNEQQQFAGQQPPQGQQQYQPQRPAGTPPPVYGQQPPPNWAQQQKPPHGQQQYQPQQPTGTPPPANGQQPPNWAQQPPQGQQQYQPQRPAGAPPPQAPPKEADNAKKGAIKPPQGVKPPDEFPNA